MESNSLEQKTFKGIVTDLNQIDLNLGEGPIADNFNGRIVQIGGNRFAWTSMSGTTKAFTIDKKAGEVIPAKRGKARVYMFDDRVFASEKNSIIDMVLSPSATHTYESIIEIQAYKSDFSTVEISSPPIQIKLLLSITTNSSSVITGTYDAQIGYRFGTTGFWSFFIY